MLNDAQIHLKQHICFLLYSGAPPLLFNQYSIQSGSGRLGLGREGSPRGKAPYLLLNLLKPSLSVTAQRTRASARAADFLLQRREMLSQAWRPAEIGTVWLCGPRRLFGPSGRPEQHFRLVCVCRTRRRWDGHEQLQQA